MVYIGCLIIVEFIYLFIILGVGEIVNITFLFLWILYLLGEINEMLGGDKCGGENKVG